MKVEEGINELFSLCSGTTGSAEFKSICKSLWMCLSNSVSLVDLAGVYTVTSPGGTTEALSFDLFNEFFRALARIKYPTDLEFTEKLINEIKSSKGLRIHADNHLLTLMVDKSVVKVLLKYDLPLRKAYSNFCGESVRVGGILNWDEVKKLSIGMEIDGFISFAGTYNMIPEYVSSQQCEVLFRNVLNKYPLSGNVSTMNTSILFPQFQLLMVMIAIERADVVSKASMINTSATEKISIQTPTDDKVTTKAFARKLVDAKSKPIAENLNDLLKDIGISKFDETMTIPDNYTRSGPSSPFRSPVKVGAAGRSMRNNMKFDNTISSSIAPPNLFAGTVVLPSSDQAKDMYTSSYDHSRQAMMLRMEHLFDEVESKVLKEIPPHSHAISLLSAPKDEIFDTKVRLPSKPVVIGDAVPVPASCPENVEQLLEASLAHHNLGSFEESLKFLEAAKMQLDELEEQSKIRFERSSKSTTEQDPNVMANKKKLRNEEDLMFFDIQMYITLCKGNVYQSCGDDEQSLLHFMEGWQSAKLKGDKDWEIVTLNSIGMLTFYNLRYDVALLCFDTVVRFREEAYGEESIDTATAWNNEACCLYCLDKRGEARVRFEKAWKTISNCVGHRARRAVTAWKNLEKARRAHAPLHNKKDLKESMDMRPDADRLLFGGTFTIQGLPPPEGGKKKGGKKKKKKKK